MILPYINRVVVSTYQAVSGSGVKAIQERIVDKVFLMNDGEILTEGNPETITEHPLAKKYYFGSHFTSK